ncbi:MAG: aminotransferase class IV [Veillonella sp.]
MFGDSVYEVVRVVKGRCFALSYHQDRLYRSMREMDIPVKMTPDDLTELHEILIEQSEIKEGYIYLQISRGVAPRHHAYDRSKLEPQMLMSIRTLDLDEVNKLGEGVKAIALPDERWEHVDIKTTNLIPNILAQTKAEKKFAYTAILFRDGICTEGATSMCLLSKMVSCIRTSDNHILKGITRQMILTRVAPSLGITSSKRI